VPDDLSSLLRINSENTVSKAARLKIIATHFSGSIINTQPFMDVDSSARHHMIAWMARDNSAEFIPIFTGYAIIAKKGRMRSRGNE
jgi:hypothetical protein